VRRFAIALFVTLTSAVLLAGCGDADEPAAPKNTAGMNPAQNASTATRYFQAVASNDPARIRAAAGQAAPGSPALSYLELVGSGLTGTGPADTVTEHDGRYRICRVGSPKTCHTYSAIVLVDGKVNDFTVDGKKIRLR